jgi:hypothetical protein
MFEMKVLFPVTFFPQIMSCISNVEKYVRAGQGTVEIIIRHMRFACWTPKATDTHSEYVILIAFKRQKWLFEQGSFLRLYVHCLSCFSCLQYLFPERF